MSRRQVLRELLTVRTRDAVDEVTHSAGRDHVGTDPEIPNRGDEPFGRRH